MKRTLLMTAAIGVLCLGGNAFATDYNSNSHGNKPAFSDMRDGAGQPGNPGNPGNPTRMRPPDEMMLQGNLDMLQLSDKQEMGIKEMEKKYSGLSSPYREKLRQLEKELMQASLKKPSNRQRVTMLTETIGKQHVRLAVIKSLFFKEMATLLTPDQLNRMANVKDRPMPPSR